MSAYAIITPVDGGYEVKVGPRTRSPVVYPEFKDAYTAGCRHTSWNYEFVFVRIHPPEFQEVMDGIQDWRDNLKKSAQEQTEKAVTSESLPVSCLLPGHSLPSKAILRLMAHGPSLLARRKSTCGHSI